MWLRLDNVKVLSMVIEKNKITIRNSDFRKYFAAHFGTTHTKRTVHLDVGNEVTTLPDKKQANVSDCQLIMDFPSFKALVELLNYEFEQIEKEFGKIKED